MFLNKLTTLLIGITFLYMLSCDGPSSDSRKTDVIHFKDTHKLNPAFWDYAVTSNLLQVELARLAVEKGTTQQIKNWGKQAEIFHSKALQQLIEISSSHATVQLPDSLVGADKRMVEEFAALQGTAFDARYQEHIIVSHKSQLSRYKEASKKTDSPGLVTWFAAMQQHMQDRLQEVALANSTEITEVSSNE